METKKRPSSTEMTESQAKKKQILDKVTNSSILPTTSLLDPEEDFRVIVGTYERLLYGINATWTDEQKTKVKMEPVFIIPAHTGCIRTVSVGGHFLASGSSDEIIRLYDVKKRKEYGSLGGHHSGDITDIKFHGKYMLSASDDQKINLWRTKDWEYLKTLKGHRGKINSMAIHPTGKIALSVASDRYAIVWNLMTGRKASVNKLGRDEGLVVLWNSEGDKYAIMFNKAVNIYNVSDAQVSSTISHTSKFHTMQYFKRQDDEFIVTGHEDKIVRIWNTSSGECVKEIKGHKLRVKALTVLECEDKIILSSVSSDGVIKCWNLGQIMDSEEEAEPLGEFNTKCRATCIDAHIGFSKLVPEAKKKEETKKDEETEKNDS
jgi:protein MAK11